LTFDPAALGVDLADPYDASAWSRGWEIPPPLTVDVWSDRNRYLTREGAAEPGPWRTDRVPFTREIMRCLSEDHPCKKVALMKSTQTAGTEVLNNFIGHGIDHAPAPMMVVMPTEKLGQRWSKQRLKTMISASPALRGKIQPATARDGGNTTLMKEFPGGLLVIAGANSASDLRSMPAKRVACDECDEYPLDLDGQGAPDEIAERRTSTFARRKVFKVSSPKHKATSVIAREFEAGDQRRYHVPCPFCGTLQVLDIDQLLPDGTYLCAHGDCGSVIEEHHKPQMLADDAMGGTAKWIAAKPDHPFPSFHINALYAPLGLGYTWAEIAHMRDQAARDTTKAVTFTNTILGLPFEGERQQQNANELEQRAEVGILRRQVPRGYYLLTIGIDCQQDRFAVHAVAWGRGERGFVVDYDEIDGDPTQQSGYDKLEAWLKAAAYRNHRGILMIPTAVAIDAGNWGEEVVKFIRRQGNLLQNRVQRVLSIDGVMAVQTLFAVRGRSQESQRVVYRPAKIDANEKGRTLARSVGIWGVGTGVAKDVLFGRMSADSRAEDIEHRMLRWPGGTEGADDDHVSRETRMLPGYFQQVASEFKDLVTGRWHKHTRHTRNEALDTLVYAYWAALSPEVRIDLKRDHEWKQLEDRFDPPVDLFTPVDPAAKPSGSGAPASPAPQRQQAPATVSRETSPAPLTSQFTDKPWSFG
jgi:phage terminase large subunit GpA-like protein